ncbi:MAG: oligopeptide/dipeptide ABC transporter ATP-binding protein [Hyphomicrobiales bacterium]
MTPATPAAPLVEVRNLAKHFRLVTQSGGTPVTLRAVDGVDLDIPAGSIVALVGESGSGKSTVAKLLTRLIDPSGGQIKFGGADLTRLRQSELRPFRRRMQIIFQDPYSSLPPHMRVKEILSDPLVIHGIGRDRGERSDRVDALMRMVGLAPAMKERFPHEFSGGQRQRIGIARALSVDPEFVIADEAVSALDVSIQAQIINLLIELIRKSGTTMLFISHNMAVVRNIADVVAVMYLGRIVEMATTEQLFTYPRHPYTEALLSAVPIPEPGAARNRIILKGEIPSPTDPPSGCTFRTRCPYALPRCAGEVPALRDVAPGQKIACVRDDLEMRRQHA